MATVCIKCSNKHPDYRSESGHLAMDPQTGATILEPHVTEPEADRDLAVLYRRYATVARKHAFAAMQARSILYPSEQQTVRENLSGRIDRYLPRAAYFTPSWLPEARRTFYMTTVR